MDLKYLIDKVFDHDTHRSSTQDGRTISTTTLIDFPYKAYKSLNKCDETFKIPSINKRGSTLGAAFHEYTEQALASEDIIQEVYAEEYLFEHDAWLSGTFDLLVWDENASEYVIADWKTSVKAFDDDSVLKAQRQMSIYRWLNRKKFNIGDVANVLFISTSRNVTTDIPIILLSLEETKEYIDGQFNLLKTQPVPDCPKWLCNYCTFSCTERK